MASITFLLPPLVAYTPGKGSAPGAHGYLYTSSDSNFDNPVATADISTKNPIDGLTADNLGVLPGCYVTVDADDVKDVALLWKSGDYIVTVLVAAAMQALIQAQLDQVQSDVADAKTLAQSASDKVDGAVGLTNAQINSYLGGPASNLVVTVAGKADLDSSTGKLRTDQLPASAVISPATNAARGVIKLTGDLAGSADSPVVPGLTSKANDTAVVHKAGAETIAGAKTFTTAPVVPDGSFAIAKVDGLQDALDNAGGGGGSSLVLDTTNYTTIL